MIIEVLINLGLCAGSIGICAGFSWIIDQYQSRGVTENYIELDEEIADRNERIEEFNKTIGFEPMQHIDWIIENGLKEYNLLYNQMVNGEIPEREEEELANTIVRENIIKSYVQTVDGFRVAYELDPVIGMTVRTDEGARVRVRIHHSAMPSNFTQLTADEKWHVIQEQDYKGRVRNRVLKL